MSAATLTPLARQRRVCKVAHIFARNMAYYRAARDGAGNYTGPQDNYWVTVDNNFLDTAVMEWCKLFADSKAQHHWGKVVSDLVAFEAALLSHIGLTAAEFADLIKLVKTYRDKFLAHLDQDNIMYPPKLDAMWAAIRFYSDHVIQQEMSQEGRDRAARESQAGRYPADLGDYYTYSFDEARAAVAKAKRP